MGSGLRGVPFSLHLVAYTLFHQRSSSPSVFLVTSVLSLLWIHTFGISLFPLLGSEETQEIFLQLDFHL